MAQQFEAEFGKQLRWLIVLSMEKIGLLQYRVSPERTNLLSDRRRELYENTVSDFWIELVDGLVDRYVLGVRDGRIHQEPMAYFRGVIRHLVLANARSLGLIGCETPREMIESFCESKRDATRLSRLAWLKFAVGEKVRQEILRRCSPQTFEKTYPAIHHVVDYFFEELIPSSCNELHELGPRVLEALAERLVNSPGLDEATEYVGSVTPFSPGGGPTSKAPDGVDEDEYLSILDQAAKERWR